MQVDPVGLNMKVLQELHMLAQELNMMEPHMQGLQVLHMQEQQVLHKQEQLGLHMQVQEQSR